VARGTAQQLNTSKLETSNFSPVRASARTGPDPLPGLAILTMQVIAAYVVIDARDAALHQCKRTLSRIRVNIAANIFPRGMANAIVAARIFRTDAPIGAKIIRDETSLSIHFVADGFFQRLASHIGNDLSTNPSIPLDRREHRGLVRPATTLIIPSATRFAANISFINLKSLTQRKFGAGRNLAAFEARVPVPPF